MISAARAGERGQAIVFAAMVMTALVGMLALVVDAGLVLQARRELQAAADAAALAGVAFLPDDTPAGRSAASSYASANAGLLTSALCRSRPAFTVASSTLPVDGGSAHTLTVAATCEVPYTFGRVLGLTQVAVGADSTAARGSLPEAPCPLPFGVEAASYAFGDLVRLKASRAQQGNFHLLDPDEGGGGSDQYRARLIHRCPADAPPLRVGDVQSVETLPGNRAGPTRDGLLQRGLVAGNGAPYVAVCPDSLQSVAPGGGLVQPRSVCLGLVPMVRSWADLNGRDAADVVGLGLFLIAGLIDEPPELYVDGYFIRGAVQGRMGPYDPYGTVVTRLVR
jgi:Flp pilus assembly protein TadG